MKEASFPAAQAGAPSRGVSLRLWREAAALAVLLGLMALTAFNAVTTDRFVADLAITEFLQKADMGLLRGLLFWMGVRGMAGVVLAATAAWLWLRGNRLEAVFVGLILVPDLSSFILRGVFDRPRPAAELVTVYGGPQGASFPSGTALHWIFFGGFMLYLLPKLTTSRQVIYGVSSLIVLWVLLMGLWVVHHGRHWPSDVFGGYLFGLFYVVLWVKLHPLARAWEARHPKLLTTVDRALRRAGARVGVFRTP
ncbi:MAG: phosphatase PAP2 family protein [Dehalococcoidia bacterium]